MVLGEGSTDSFDNRFFDSLFVDTTQLKAKTYITIDTEIVSAKNNTVKCIQIIIDFFTNTSILPLTTTEQKKYYTIGYYGNRVDVGIDIIKRTISDLDIGIGKLTMSERNPVRIIQPTSSHYGKRLIFEIYDF